MDTRPRAPARAAARLGRSAGPGLAVLVLLPVAALLVLTGDRLAQQCFTLVPWFAPAGDLDLLSATAWCPDGTVGLTLAGKAAVLVAQGVLCVLSVHTALGAGGAGLARTVIRCARQALQLIRATLWRLPDLRPAAGPRLTRAGPPAGALVVTVAVQVATTHLHRGPPVVR